MNVKIRTQDGIFEIEEFNGSFQDFVRQSKKIGYVIVANVYPWKAIPWHAVRECEWGFPKK